MKTAVVVTRGRRRARTGYIYGTLPPPHPLVTKALVIFGPEEDAAIPIENLAPAGRAIAQLELALETEKEPPPARRPAAELPTGIVKQPGVDQASDGGPGRRN